MTDYGNFIFYEDAFSTVFNGFQKFYEWNEIEKIVAYKKDKITTDQICLELFFKDFKLLFTEDFTGWYEFLDRMHQYFPQINQNWQLDIVKPVFMGNETVIYQSNLQQPTT